MRTLEFKRMRQISGGDAVCSAGGVTLAAGVFLLGAGIATGGLGFFVGAGVLAYSGTTVGILCLMRG